METLSAHWLIMPVGTWKEQWDVLMLSLILYSAWLVPLRVCFDADAEGVWLWAEIIMSLCFLVDIVFTFNTVYFDVQARDVLLHLPARAFSASLPNAGAPLVALSDGLRWPPQTSPSSRSAHTVCPVPATACAQLGARRSEIGSSHASASRAST